jgi:general secretion pathway protein C
MRVGSPGRWTVHGATFALWALAALCAAYWVLRFVGTPAVVNSAAPPSVRTPAAADPAAVARLLGAAQSGEAGAAPPPALASRLVLTGVVAQATGGGAALIAVDGRPPRPFRVGQQLDEGLVLQSVQGRRALVGTAREGPTLIALELPPLPH